MAEPAKETTESRYLKVVTRNYVTALGLIALVLLGSFGLMMSRLRQNEVNALILVTAGQQ